jgi:uncharacterized UPF0160 family protein
MTIGDILMKTDTPVRIGTHDGSFHSDEVLAIAILTTLHPNHHIVRTRDPDTLSWMDVVVDVGGIYDNWENRYDHHMPNPPQNKDGHVYSSAGLIWRHFAHAYLKAIGLPRTFTFENTTIDLHTAVEKSIRIKWIEPIDRNDNGVTQELTPITVLVQSMRPTDPLKSKANFDKAFLETVSMVSHIFSRSCFHAADYAIAQTKHIVAEKDFLHDGKTVVTKHPIPTYRTYARTPVHFSICPSVECEGVEPNFIIHPIPQDGSKSLKTPVPAQLLGANRDMVEELTGLTGIAHIHHSGFVIHADTQEEAIQFVEYCFSCSS